MMKSTHLLGGFAAWAAMCALARTPGVVITGGLISAAAAPCCDLDNVGAWSARKRRQIGLKRGRNGRYKLRMRLVRWRLHPVKWRIARGLAVLGEHREGPAHSLPGTAAFAAVFVLPWVAWPAYPAWVALAVLTGLWSHLALDLATLSPVPGLCWPWLIRDWHGLPLLLRCRVGGGTGETVWRGLLAGLLVLALLVF